MRLDPARALVVLVSEDGIVENRLLDLPPGLPPSALTEAGNFLNARVRGQDARRPQGRDRRAATEMERELDVLTARLVEAGLATPVGAAGTRQLIVRGQANLLEDLRAADDLERIRLLFADLETQTDVIDLLTRAEGGEGVRIFIGSENKLFSLSGSSMIAAPFRDGDQHHRRRARRDRPDPAQLRPHRADGGLHGQGDLAAAGERAVTATSAA